MFDFKRIVLFISFCGLFSGQLYSKFSLNKIKDNIKDSFRYAKKQTKESFNKLVKKTKKEQAMDPGELNKKAFFNAIENVNSAMIKGLGVYDRRLAKKLKKAGKFIDNTFWAKQKNFIDILENSYEESRDNARDVLYEKLFLIYPSEKAPLIKFAVDIDNENVQAQSFIEKLSSFNVNLLEDKTKGDELHITMHKLEDIVIQIDRLSLLTNKLLQA